MSEFKTIILLAGLAVLVASFLKVGGLKLSTGLAIGGVMVIAGNLIPDPTTKTS